MWGNILTHIGAHHTSYFQVSLCNPLLVLPSRKHRGVSHIHHHLDRSIFPLDCGGTVKDSGRGTVLYCGVPICGMWGEEKC
jgi:hypothetical protein